MGLGKIDGMPGFRFHPTEQELVGFYLRSMVEGNGNAHDFIRTVDLYSYEPWELRDMAPWTREKESFFFVPRDSKFPNGGRPNRRTKSGYWKATGTDRHVQAGFEDPANCVGLKKTLVYYEGRAPNGKKTDWIMNEYRLSYGDSKSVPTKEAFQSSITLCRIYRKDNPWRQGDVRHVVGTEVPNQEASSSERPKSLLLKSNAETQSTADWFSSENTCGRQFYSTTREFSGSSVAGALMKPQSSPHRCFSNTWSSPQLNPGAHNLKALEQDMRSRDTEKAGANEAAPVDFYISTLRSCAASAIADHRVPVLERKACVPLLSDLAHYLDLDIKDMEEMELRPSVCIEPLHTVVHQE